MAGRRSAATALIVGLLTGSPLQALGETDNSTTAAPSLRGSFQCVSRSGLCGSNGHRTAVCCAGLQCEAWLGSFDMRCADKPSPAPPPPPPSTCREIGCGSQGSRRNECECIEECLLRGTCCSDFWSTCKASPTPPPPPPPAPAPVPPTPAPPYSPPYVDGNYLVYVNKNAYAPYGAVDIDTDATARSGLTQSQCESVCTADPECMCVTWRRSDGTCWRRKDCVPSQWTSNYNSGYDVCMKRYSSPTPSSPPPAAAAPQAEPSFGSSFELRWAGQANTCMDVAGGRDENFNKIQVWACDYPENQKFYFDRVQSYTGRGQIRWAKDPSMCLDVIGISQHVPGHTNNFADVVLHRCHSSNDPDFDHQVFDVDAFAPVVNVGSTSIRWKSKCVDLNNGVVGSSSQSDSKVITYDCHARGDPDWIHQQWNVEYGAR